MVAVQDINTRRIEKHGFSPAEILLRFQPRHSQPVPVGHRVLNDVEHTIGQEVDLTPGIEGRMARMQEARDILRDRRHDSPSIPPSGRLREGDLVLLWDTVLEKEKGRKLDPR
ncbi:hypothetical protein IFM46972_00366 [Aspergillus udagawae]|uniref:Uncharacterized protein n=1 Tax=Aspergillus udagawae TaxID=91492 RepID=A0A8H3RGI7_9EURO|nr:hypothetical protein IFM46972_00366 [Aspergillus udagawae]